MVRRGIVLLTLALAAVVFGLPNAGAGQGGLAASNPAAQSALAAPPAAVELTFTATPTVPGSHVSILDGDGATVNAGDLALVAGRTLRQPVSIGTSGDFTVAYHVEFVDGGESSGSLRFSVGTGAAPPAPDQAVQAATAAVIADHGHGIDPVSAVLLLVDGLVVLGVLALLYLRRPVRPLPEADRD